MTEVVAPDLFDPPHQTDFEPTRAAGLARLEQFVSRAGRAYAKTRNYDFGPDRRGNVSCLSPWLRHRLITEAEVLQAVLARHTPEGAEKFIAEVFWRTYFKGWLEQHPSVWDAYQRGVVAGVERLEADTDLRARYDAAAAGATGIDCFDHWIAELERTGYLHNHARMWVASIWIFTLRLPWELGADLFLRHLIDGDPASNTLSWRWVGGLHTKGKTYLARADNIAKFTDGRFAPQGLARVAAPLSETQEHPRCPVPRSNPPPESPALLVLTEDDLSGRGVLPETPAGVLGLLSSQGRSVAPVGAVAQSFAERAMASVLPPGEAPREAEDWATPILETAHRLGVRTVVTAYPPVGPARTRFDAATPVLRDLGLEVLRVRRPYDSAAWPHAKAGFFGLKKKIPDILLGLGLTR